MSAGYGPPADQGEMIQLPGSFRNEEQRYEYEIFFRRSTRLPSSPRPKSQHDVKIQFCRLAQAIGM
jgi:hypothetical protein